MKKLIAVVALLLIVALAGCTTQAGMATIAQKASAAPSPTPKKDLTAAQIVAALKKAGLPVRHEITFDEKTDQNALLGRPGGYISKASFLEPRDDEMWDFSIEYDESFDPVTYGYGYTVETFKNTSEMQKRYDYLNSMVDTGGIVSPRQYIYKYGKAILRVSYDLTPSEAKKYEQAFYEIMK
jgi:hypothetical protein